MSEFQPARPRQRNREVPFPDHSELYQARDLENVILQDQIFEYDLLPDSLSSGTIDRYATWLAQLTNGDVLKRERGSSLFISSDNVNRWTLPKNPLVGDEKTVSRLITRRPDKHLPFIGFHSHPDSTAPSGIDIYRMIVDKGLYFEGGNDAFCEVVGAQGFNYLILRTSDSLHLDSEGADNIVKEYQDIVNNSALQLTHFFRNLLVDLGTSDVEITALFEKLKEEEWKLFGSDYTLYFQTLNTVNALCELQKFGFYRSKQDGVFTKITREDIASIGDQEGSLILSVIQGVTE